MSVRLEDQVTVSDTALPQENCNLVHSIHPLQSQHLFSTQLIFIKKSHQGTLIIGWLLYIIQAWTWAFGWIKSFWHAWQLFNSYTWTLLKWWRRISGNIHKVTTIMNFTVAYQCGFCVSYCCILIMSLMTVPSSVYGEIEHCNSWTVLVLLPCT